MVDKMEWNGRHKTPMVFIILMSTIVLYEVVVFEIENLGKTVNEVLQASPRFLRQKNYSLLTIEKKRSIFEQINGFLRQVSKSQRFERNSKLRKKSLSIIESLNRLKPGHLPEKDAGKNVTLILNAVQEWDATWALLSDLSDHLPEWSKQTRILVALNNKTYKKLAFKLKRIKVKLPYFNWVILPEDQSKSLVNTLVSSLQRVSTPYVFLARGVRGFEKEFNWNSFLRPLVHEHVDVISGAVKYANGHWNSGCHQSKLIWGQYKTQHGYDLKYNHNGNSVRPLHQKWIRCNYFDGPLAIKKETFLNMLSPIIRKICPDHMVYRHLIYTLNNHKTTMIVSQTHTFNMDFKKELTRRQWLDFAFLNEISEVISLSEDQRITHHEFNNTELNSVCSNKLNMLKPRACIRDLHDVLMSSYKLFDK